MLLQRTTVSIWALMAATPTLAQVFELEKIVISGSAEESYFGESVSLDTGTVSKTGDTILETPRSVNVITAQQIAERGGQGIDQILQYSAGIVGGQWGLDARSDWSLIRGFDPSTLHDGLQARYGYYNDTSPEPFLLNSVEVLKGPASGLYGSGSVGGVVNTTSKTAAQDSDNMIQVQAGSYDRLQLAADVSGKLNSEGTLRYRFVGLLRDSEAAVNYSKDDAIALAPSITWRPSDNTELTLLANYQKNDSSPLIQFSSIYGTLLPATGFGNGDYLDSDVFVGEPGFDKFNTEQRALTAMFKHRFNSTWNMNLNARYLEGEGDYQHAWWTFDNFGNGRYNADGTINRTFYRAENELKTFGIDGYATADYTLAGIEMRTILGASYSQGYYDTDYAYGAQVAPIDPFNPVYAGFNPITVADSPGNTIIEWGFYAQQRAVFQERLFVDLGLRYGDIETGTSNGSFGATTVAAQDSAWTANAAFMYRFDNGLAPYFSYAESFRQDAIGADVNGTPFDPTRGEQYELGVKYQPVGTDTLLTAAVFDVTKSNMLLADPANPNFQIQNGEASSKGIELEGFQRFGDFAVNLAYTYLDTEDAQGDYIAQAPKNAASLWVSYAPEDGALAGWTLGAGSRYVGESWGGASTYLTPSTLIYDASVSYRKDNWLVALNMRNLTDERYITTCQSGACYFGEGRTATLTVTSKF